MTYLDYLAIIYNNKNDSSPLYILFNLIRTVLKIVELPWIDHDALRYAQNSK